MFMLKRPMDINVAPGIFAIGLLCGLGLMISSIRQGACCAAAINASKNKPEIAGISLAPAAIIEGFSIFVFVFAIVLIGSIGGK